MKSLMFKRKKRASKKVLMDLIKDADKLACEAETKNDLKLVGRSNDLRKIS